jgi:hypothetical protein
MRRRNSSFIPADSIYPFAGVDYNDPSTLVDVHFATELQNVNVDKGHLAKRFGHTMLGSAIDGIPLALFEFETFAGVVKLICITTTREYVWNGSDWDDITYRPNGAGSGTDKTGTEDDGIDYVIASGTDSSGQLTKWVIITNGVDTPRWWDGTNSVFWQYSTATQNNASRGAGISYTNFATMKAIASFKDYIVLGNVTTTSNEPGTITWSKTGSLTDFGFGTSQGNSGSRPMTDIVGPIRKPLVLSDRLMIYSDDTIHGVTHTGGTEIFSFERLLSDTRLASARSVVDVSGSHMFLGQENVYLFDGTRNLLPLADLISLRTREELQSDLKARAWAFLDKAKNNVYWCIPTGDDTSNIYKMEFNLYDLKQVRWTKLVYPNRLTVMGFWRRNQNLAWDELTATWAGLSWNWNQGSVKAGFPQRVLGFGQSVALEDDTVWTDNDEVVDAFWDSIDLTPPEDAYLGELGRFSQIELELRGGEVEVYYSVDRGANFVLADTLELTGSFTRYKVDIDVVGASLRVRVRNKAANGFEFRWLRVMLRSGGLDG